MESEPYLIDIEHDYPAWNEEIPRNFDIVGETVEAIFQAYDIKRAEISILLASDDRIHELNARFRDKDTATNVLSFPPTPVTRETIHSVLDSQDVPMLGDIIIAFQTMKKEAKELDKPLEHHLRHLVVHAVLHLLGYDHIEDEDADIMEGEEVKLLEKWGIPNPYIDEEALC